MLQKLRAGIALVAIGCAFVSAQGTHKAEVDPGTGIAGGSPSAASGAIFVQGTGAGQVIGYTTDAVIGSTTLDELTLAFDDLVADGNTLVPINVLTPANLAQLDCLFVGLVYVGLQLSKEQIDTIELFARHGGKLVFLGENNTYFHENNVAVGTRFRVGFPETDPPEIVLTDVNVHPITQGPHGTVAVLDGSRNGPTFYGSMLSPGPKGFSLVDFPGGGSAGIVIEPGNFGPTAGLIVFFAEIDIWTDNAYQLADNRALWRNTFAYDPAPAATVASQGLKPGLRALLAQQ